MHQEMKEVENSPAVNTAYIRQYNDSRITFKKQGETKNSGQY